MSLHATCEVSFGLLGPAVGGREDLRLLLRLALIACMRNDLELLDLHIRTLIISQKMFCFERSNLNQSHNVNGYLPLNITRANLMNECVVCDQICVIGAPWSNILMMQTQCSN